MEFKAAVGNLVAVMQERGGSTVMLIAKTRRGPIPVGIALTPVFQAHAYPHAIWFPWASARNKIECGVQFFIALKAIMKAMVTSRMDDAPYFDHLAHYGLLRRVGTLRKDYQGHDFALYETVS